MGIIISVINAIITVLTFAVIIYTLLRFFMDPYHPLINALGQVVEPVLALIRKRVPPMGGFDFSPLIFIILLQVLGSILTALLRSIG